MKKTITVRDPEGVKLAEFRQSTPTEVEKVMQRRLGGRRAYMHIHEDLSPFSRVVERIRIKGDPTHA